MSDDNIEVAEDKKAAKAELKAAKKAKKAAKEAEKLAERAKRKAEKQERKQASEENSPAPDLKHKVIGKKSKASKTKTKPMFANAVSLGAKLQAVARLARGHLASQLLEHGLYAGQEQVLFILDEYGPVSLAELADKLDVRAPTITKTVTRMEAQAFLSRAVSRDDARSIIIALTPEGRHVLKICRRIVADIEVNTFSVLDGPECESLDKMLDLVFSQIKDVK